MATKDVVFQKNRQNGNDILSFINSLVLGKGELLKILYLSNE